MGSKEHNLDIESIEEGAPGSVNMSPSEMPGASVIVE